MSVRSKGFTLVELLVTIPIFMLIVATLIGFLINLYAGLLMKDARVQMALEAQEALSAIQDDLYFARNFAEAPSAAMTDANGPGGSAAGWTYNTTPITLIVYEMALDKPRQDSNRQLVYQRTAASGNSCAPADIEQNPPVLNNLIYFISNNTLKRRILVPDPVHSRCSEPVSQQSCPTTTTRERQLEGGGTDTVPCPADATLATSVSSFAIDYFDIDGNPIDLGAGGSPLQAERMTLRIRLERKIIAETITHDAELTVKKINSGDPEI